MQEQSKVEVKLTYKIYGKEIPINQMSFTQCKKALKYLTSKKELKTLNGICTTKLKESINLELNEHYNDFTRLNNFKVYLEKKKENIIYSKLSKTLKVIDSLE